MAPTEAGSPIPVGGADAAAGPPDGVGDSCMWEWMEMGTILKLVAGIGPGMGINICPRAALSIKAAGGRHYNTLTLPCERVMCTLSVHLSVCLFCIVLCFTAFSVFNCLHFFANKERERLEG